jgi:hypothetical protein
MDLESIIRCLIDHYRWVDEVSKLREISEILRKLAEEAGEYANDDEKRLRG